MRASVTHFLLLNNNFLSLPVPKEATLVLIDMDPTQFLSDGTTITGLVDTEAMHAFSRI